jgi:hypothetical protein
MQPSLNPQKIDQTIHLQGKDIFELLQMYKQSTTEPSSSFMLPTPEHKTKSAPSVDIL